MIVPQCSFALWNKSLILQFTVDWHVEIDRICFVCFFAVRLVRTNRSGSSALLNGSFLDDSEKRRSIQDGRDMSLG